MSIKQRITVGFVLLVAALLLLFSFFIFQTYESYRASLMRTRLQRRALAAQAFFDNRSEFQRSSYLTLPEQDETLFDEQNQPIYSSSGPDDYPHQTDLLQNARSEEVYFTYTNPQWQYPKEGVALPIRHKGHTYVVIVTAYDLTGRQTSRNLVFILGMGNILSLLVIALVGFMFARRAMRPFDDLIGQMNQTTVNDFSFRLKNASRPDEAGYLAGSFNQLLGRLQNLAVSQENFVSYASHEIRTPLTVVKGLLETAIAYDETLPAAQLSMENALRRLDSAIELANTLLQLAEVEGLNTNRFLEDVNPLDTVFDTVSYIQEKYPQQQLDLQLSDQFTQQSSAIRLVGNVSLLRTVLINIVDNACKYSHFQPVNILVDYQPDWVSITVVDQGIGIPKAEVLDVFLPMMRAGNVGKLHGFGLGLTLARKIVDLHRGQLQIDSEMGKGTTASLRLPVLPV